MEPDQFGKMIEALTELGETIAKSAQAQYTITGAADWPILVALCGIISLFLVVLMGMVGSMKSDIIATIKENRQEWREELEKAEGQLWDETRAIRGDMKYCKEKCIGSIGGGGSSG